MPLFQKKQPEAPETTGTDVIREALRVRSKSAMFSTVNLAKDLGVPDSVLTNFIATGVRPRPDVVHALVKFLLHGHAIWDEALDRLKPANANPVVSLGVRPPPSPINLPAGFTPGRAGDPLPLGLRPVKDPPPQPEPSPRPGWV